MDGNPQKLRTRLISQNHLEFTGAKSAALDQIGRDNRLLVPYVASRELVEAVNLAIYLGRPLLLRGEPGCGKSLLAGAVAYELDLPLEVWTVRSTTRAADGLYTYDAVARLRDAQFAAAVASQAKARLRLPRMGNLDISRYIRLGPLGRSCRSEQRMVLLIDEIDKADIDFPNDILDVLAAFTIEETGERVIANQAPIIFVTSNDEKDLPEAFLRRCVFAYVPFPDEERCRAILRAHFGLAPEDLIVRAVQRFRELRQRQERDDIGGTKKVSTSELIDWVRVMLRNPKGALSDLQSGRPYPHHPVLIKRREDRLAAQRVMSDDEQS